MKNNYHEVKPGFNINKATFVYKKIGPALEHNYLCAVCMADSAVFYSNENILQPCWECQKHGYYLFRVNRIVKWILMDILK